jgi:hypothetical protein
LPQHGWPAPPQATHWFPWQVTPGAVQLLLAQVPPRVGQSVPPDEHTSATQQPPPEQALPAQHASPALPQWVQTPPLHTAPDSQARPGQQP